MSKYNSSTYTPKGLVKSIDELQQDKLILYSYIRGSQAYGCALPTSDTDTGGVFISPLFGLFGLPNWYVSDVRSDRNDDVYYELKKFFKMLGESDPNTTEALFVDKKYRTYVHPLFETLLESRDKFLTKKLAFRFMEFATSQIRKARGLNKKIVNPVKERKTITDFCYVLTDTGYGTMPLKKFLDKQGIDLNTCGCVNVPNAPGTYALFQDTPVGEFGFSGIEGIDGTNLKFSSVPPNQKPIALFFFNLNDYSMHCRSYREYKEWEAMRNPVRYESNLGMTYDSKNLMHCFRLLNIAKEIAGGEGFNSDRSNIDREFLLDIRNHKYEYDDLMKMSDELENEIKCRLEKCDLPDVVDMSVMNNTLVLMYALFYDIDISKEAKKLVKITKLNELKPDSI